MLLFKKWGGVVSLIVFGILISLLLLEGIVRVWNPPFFNSHLRTYHPELGWTSKVNTVLYRVVNQDRVVRYETNELGFRDVNHSTERARNTAKNGQIKIRRLVVLGDSFSESAQVNLDQTFWRLLGKKLNANSHDYWEVHNFGVGDYGTLQQLMTLETFALTYKPDIVLLQVFPQNDIYNNSLSGANIASNQDAYRPYLNPEDNFNSITYVAPLTNRLRQNSYLFRALSPVLAKVFGPVGNEKAFATMTDRMEYVRKRAHEYGFEPQGRVKPFDYFLVNAFATHDEQISAIREGWLATEAAMTKIITIAKANRAKPMVVVIPHISMIEPDSKRFKGALPYQFDRYYAEKRISTHVQKQGVPFIGLLAPFEENSSVVKPYIDGHLNIATHQLVSNILFDNIRQNFPEYF